MNGQMFYRWIGPEARISLCGHRYAQLHLMQQWLEQPTSGKITVVATPLYAGAADEVAESCIAQGARFRHNNSNHFRGVTLWLRGKDSIEEKRPIFAILVINLSEQKVLRAMFSPVEFGEDNRPVLPYDGKNLEMFLHVVRAVQNDSESSTFTPDTLLRDVRKAGHFSEQEFSRENAFYWIEELDRLRLIRYDDLAFRIWRGNASLWRLKDIFGLDTPGLVERPGPCNG